MAEFNFYLIDGSTETLIEDPVGWDQTTLSLSRDANFIGVFTSYSSNLEFVGDGYDIIVNKYEALGPEAELLLRVEYKCDDSFVPFYTGKLNFTNYTKKTSDYCSVTVNVEDISPSVTIRNRADVEVDLQSLSSIGGQSVAVVPGLINAMTLESRVIRKAGRAVQTSGAGSSFTSAAAAPQAIVLITKSQYSEVGDENSFNVGLPGAGLTTANFINNDTALTYTVRSRLKGRIINSGGTTFNFLPWVYRIKSGEAYDSPASNILAFFKDTTDPLGSPPFTAAVLAGNTLEFDLDLTNLPSFTLSSDQGVGVVTVELISNGGTIEIDPESFLYMYSDTITSPSICATALIHEAASSLFARVMDQYNSFRSTLFGRVNSEPISYAANGPECFYALTNGYQIRQFPLLERPIFLTVDSLFNGLNACFNIGMGLEKDGSQFIVRMEKKQYFFEPQHWLTFDDINEITETIASDLLYNTVEIGFSKYGAEERDTKFGTVDAFATSHQYATTSKTLTGKQSLKSELIADHYALEFARRQPYVDEATVEHRYDEDVFIIATKRGLSYGIPSQLDENEQDENFDQVNNIISPETAYNLRLSPKHNLLRWMYWLSGVFYKSVSKKLNFKEGKKNYAMTSEFTADTTDASYNDAVLAEDQDIDYTDVNLENKGPLFEPLYVEFEYPLSFDQFLSFQELNSLSGKPNAYHAIRYGRDADNLKSGYLWSVDYDVNAGKAQFKLLKKP